MCYSIYLRKSRKDVEVENYEEGETLARHRKILLDFAEKNKLAVSKIYEEIVSGESIAARPQMQQLLADVERGLYKGVIVIEVERLARGDTIDQGIVAQAFKYSDTKIITPVKTYDPSNEFDEEYFEFGLFMSRREYKTINRRLQRGRAAAAKEGKYIASIAPYGYEKVRIEGDKGYTLKIISEQAEVIKNIFDWYINGCNGEKLGLGGIAKKLNDMKIKPCRHEYWVKETIRDIIANPVYEGKIRWGFRKVKKTTVDGKIAKSRPINYDESCILEKGLHQAIVSEEIYNKAQEILKASSCSPVGQNKELKNPLAGIIVCSKCGHKMTLRNSSQSDKPDYIVCNYRYCSNVSSPYELVERKIMNILQVWLKDYRLNWEGCYSSQDYSNNDLLEKNMQYIAKRISALNQQINNMYDLLEQKIYTPQQFLSRYELVSKRLENAKTEYREIKEKQERLSSRLYLQEAFIPNTDSILDIYKSLSSPSAKNALLKELIEKCVYTKEKSAAYKDVSVDDFTLILYPKLPKNSML